MYLPTNAMRTVSCGSHTLEQVVPLSPVDITERQIQPAYHVGVELLAMQYLGNVVDRRRVGSRITPSMSTSHISASCSSAVGHAAIQRRISASG